MGNETDSYPCPDCGTASPTYDAEVRDDGEWLKMSCPKCGTIWRKDITETQDD